MAEEQTPGKRAGCLSCLRVDSLVACMCLRACENWRCLAGLQVGFPTDSWLQHGKEIVKSSFKGSIATTLRLHLGFLTADFEQEEPGQEPEANGGGGGGEGVATEGPYSYIEKCGNVWHMALKKKVHGPCTILRTRLVNEDHAKMSDKSDQSGSFSVSGKSELGLSVAEGPKFLMAVCIRPQSANFRETPDWNLCTSCSFIGLCPFALRLLPKCGLVQAVTNTDLKHPDYRPPIEIVIFRVSKEASIVIPMQTSPTSASSLHADTRSFTSRRFPFKGRLDIRGSSLQQTANPLT